MVEICPRCGLPGYLKTARRGNRAYFYIEHRLRLGEKIKYKKCYIGPTSQYKYVEKFHALALTNFPEQDYLVVAREAIHRFVEKKTREASLQVDREKELAVLREAEIHLTRLVEYIYAKIKELRREQEAMTK